MSADTQPPIAALTMAEVRRQLAPEPNHPDAKRERCQGCGEMFWRWKGRRRRWCIECAAARGAAAELGMGSRDGPIYREAALKAHAYWHGELVRLGLITAGP